MMKKSILSLGLFMSLMAHSEENRIQITVESREGHYIKFGIPSGDGEGQRRKMAERTQQLIGLGHAQVQRDARGFRLDLNDKAIAQLLTWGTGVGYKKNAVELELYVEAVGATPEDSEEIVTLMRIPLLKSVSEGKQRRDYRVSETFQGRGVFPDQSFVASGKVDIDGSGDPLRFNNPELYKRELLKAFDAAEKEAGAIAKSADIEKSARKINEQLSVIIAYANELQQVDPATLDREVFNLKLDSLKVVAASKEWFNGRETQSRIRILKTNLAHLRLRVITW